MAWNDIPKWQTMSKVELMEELNKRYSNDPLLEQTKWIYVNNCYELTASVNQKRPNDAYIILKKR